MQGTFNFDMRTLFSSAKLYKLIIYRVLKHGTNKS